MGACYYSFIIFLSVVFVCVTINATKENGEKALVIETKLPKFLLLTPTPPAISNIAVRPGKNPSHCYFILLVTAKIIIVLMPTRQLLIYNA